MEAFELLAMMSARSIAFGPEGQMGHLITKALEQREES
jgi:hypothetical protein